MGTCWSRIPKLNLKQVVFVGRCVTVSNLAVTGGMPSVLLGGAHIGMNSAAGE
jgi:hypothetical protein